MEEKKEVNQGIVKAESTAISPADLTFEHVKRYICPTATPQEMMMFLQLCKHQNLNPFLREAYLIKYKPDEPASIVVSKDAFMKRASKIPNYDGFQAGIVVERKTESGSQIEFREGALLVEGEKLIGGWCNVFRKDRTYPCRVVVNLSEYVRKKKDGTLTRPWAEMPATMIRKVAIVQAHREMFPEELGGIYTPEEMSVDTSELPEYKLEPITIQPTIPEPKPVEEKKPAQEKKEPEKESGESDLSEVQVELLAALIDLYDGDEEKVKQRLIDETSFVSKRDGRLIKGVDDVAKVKDVSARIILRKILKELSEKYDKANNLELPLEEVEK